MTKIKEIARAIWEGVFRNVFPFLICVFGGGLCMMFSTDKDGWILVFGAGVSFAWALDLAATRAAARARVDTAMQITRGLMSGNDSTITVEIFDGRKPDSIIAEAEQEGE